MTLPVRDLPSPSQDERSAGTPIDTIVLHYTGTNTLSDAIRLLHDPDRRASVHYLVDEDGTVARLVPEARRAFHAGPSYWRGRTDLDDRSIGISLVNPGHAQGYRDFAVLQLAVVCDLCLEILSRHDIGPRDIVAHSDIAPQRALGPGERFDWAGLADNGIGLWPAAIPDLGIRGAVRDADSLRDVRAALRDIGYDAAPEGALDPALSAVLRAFQRHWRPESITGQADSGTLARLLAVARMCQRAS